MCVASVIKQGRRETGRTDLANQDIEALIEDFAFLDDWEDRYRFVIELGKDLPVFDTAERTDHLKVEGCVSQVWLKISSQDSDAGPILVFSGDSDAHIVRGLIAILIVIYSGKSPAEILGIDVNAVLHRIGLDEHLTPQRSNGLQAMVQRIRQTAQGMSKAAPQAV